jgi:hypothetical protein
MNRRQFNKSLAALAAAPAMPPHMASGIPAPAIPPALYAKASHFARLWRVSSADAMQNILSVDQPMAQAVFAKLQSDNILGIPDAHGVAQCVMPWFNGPSGLSGGAAAKEPAHLSHKIKDVLKDQSSAALSSSSGASEEPSSDPNTTSQILDPSISSAETDRDTPAT